jgi:hypothetical protein
VPFDKQTPRRIPKQTENDRQVIVRASDWNLKTGIVAADGVRLFTPATALFESFVSITSPVSDPRWMHDARRVYYRRSPPVPPAAWFVLDTRTREERRIMGTERVEDANELVLSADSRRAYVLSMRLQSDIWRMDIK